MHFTSSMLGLCCEQFEPMQQAKHSSSAVEVTSCFSQVRKIWLQLAWPDSAGAFIFITRLTDVSATSMFAHSRMHILHTKKHEQTQIRARGINERFCQYKVPFFKVWNCFFIIHRISAARLCATQN